MRPIAPPLFLLIAALLVLSGTIGFASLRPEYSHFQHTISELGEFGAALGAQVSYGVFLPAGLLIWAAVYLAANAAMPRETKVVLAFLSCLGTGYVMAAVFPCDPGSPLSGTWRQQVHNFFGFVEYAGTAVGLALGGLYLRREGVAFLGSLLALAGLLVLLCLVGLSIASAFPIRGGIQRLAETVMFLGSTAFLAALRSEA